MDVGGYLSHGTCFFCFVFYTLSPFLHFTIVICIYIHLIFPYILFYSLFYLVVSTNPLYTFLYYLNGSERGGQGEGLEG